MPPQVKSLSQTWQQAQAQLAPIHPTPREGQILTAHALNVPLNTLLLRATDEAPASLEAHLQSLIQKRLQGIPLAYITGKAPFWSRDWHVREGVLIPRPDTETLVQAVLNTLPPDSHAHIAEVGVGSGAIIGSILLERPHVTAIATDISPTALDVTRHNITEAGVIHRCNIVQTNLLEDVNGPFHLILSNPPYISETEYNALEPTVRNHEPKEALLAANNGLAIYQTLIPQAASKLRTHGWLMLEIGWQQAQAVQQFLPTHTWKNIQTIKDLAGRPRVITAQRC